MADEKKNPNVTDDEDGAAARELEVQQHPDRFGGPISDKQDKQGNSVNLDVEPDPTKGPRDE